MARYTLKQCGRFWFIWDKRCVCLVSGLNGRTRRFTDHARAERALGELQSA